MKHNFESPQEDFKKLDFDYCVLSARFLLTNDFKKYEEKFKELALRGHKKSLITYLENVPNFRRDPKIIEKSEEILKKQEKTVEDCEIVVAFLMYDKAEVFMVDSVNTVKDLKLYLDSTFRNYKLKKHIDKFEEDVARMRYERTFEYYKKQPYAKAVTVAQTKCFEKMFLSSKNLKYPHSFLELTQGCDIFLFPYTKVKKTTGLIPTRHYALAKLMSDFKDKAKNGFADIWDCYAYASATFKHIIQGDRRQRQGRKILTEIARTPLSDENIIGNNLNKSYKKEAYNTVV